MGSFIGWAEYARSIPTGSNVKTMTRVRMARLRFIFNKQIGTRIRYKVFKRRLFPLLRAEELRV